MPLRSSESTPYTLGRSSMPLTSTTGVSGRYSLMAWRTVSFWKPEPIRMAPSTRRRLSRRMYSAFSASVEPEFMMMQQ